MVSALLIVFVLFQYGDIFDRTKQNSRTDFIQSTRKLSKEISVTLIVRMVMGKLKMIPTEAV